MKILKLDNGATLLQHTTPSTGIATVQVWLRVGSAYENVLNNGISHFLEHMLFKGTQKYSPDDIDNKIESLGGIMNAGTGKDITNYHITLPVFSNNMEVAFDILSEMLFNSLFISEEIEKEKPVVLQEINMDYDDPTYEMWKCANEALYKGYSYSMEIIGTAENVNSFNRDQLVGYYNSYYHPGNMTVVVVGDIDTGYVEDCFNKYFSYKARADIADMSLPIWERKLASKASRIFHKDVAQDYAFLATQLNADMGDKAIYDVVTDILSGGDYSLLNGSLKYDKRVVTWINASDTLNKGASAYCFNLVTPPSGMDNAVNAMLDLIKNLDKDIIAKQYLDKSKNRIKSRETFLRERAGGIAGKMGYCNALGILNEIDCYLEKVNKITVDDVFIAIEDIMDNMYIDYRTVSDKV